MGLFRPSTWSVEGFAQATYDALNPVYGEGAPLEFVAEAVAPIVPVVSTGLATTAAVTQGAYYDVGLAQAVDNAQEWVTADTEPVVIPDIISETIAKAQDWVTADTTPAVSEDVSDSWRDIITPYAEAYTDWYEAGTPVERAVDVLQETGTGIATETTDLITETIEATAVPIAVVGETIVQPLAEETGDVLESLAIPIALVGGAILLLK
jgi:hypothetical protein